MKTLWVLALLCLSSMAFGQKLKVKLKDNLWFINDRAYMLQGCRAVVSPCVFSSPFGDKKYFALVPYKYRATRTRLGKGGYNYNEDYDAYYYHVRFLTVEKEFYTNSSPYELIQNMYNSNIINSSGEIDMEKLEEFLRIYSEEPPVRVGSMD